MVEKLSRVDERIHLLKRTESSSGANVCRNLGLRESSSDLIVFLDSDDTLRPHCLMRRVEFMQRNQDLDFAVFRAGIFDATPGDRDEPYHSFTYGDDLLRFLSHECVWQTTGPVWRRQFLYDLGGFDDSMPSMQDLNLHIRAIVTGARYVLVDEFDHDIRGHDDELRTSRRHFREPGFIQAAETAQEEFLRIVTESGYLTWSRSRAILGMLFSTCELWRANGFSKRARQSWVRACRLLDAPMVLCLEGLVLLALLPMGQLASRLIDRWKGWRRLRPEPVPENLFNR
jgi:hypothetical protein